MALQHPQSFIGTESATMDPFPQSFVRNHVVARYLSQRLVFIFNIISFVVCLLDQVRPLAIFRGIGTVIINTIESLTCLGFAHVGQKVFERITPAFANCDAAATVIPEGGIVGIIAALFHMAPHAVNPRGILSVSVPCLGPTNTSASAVITSLGKTAVEAATIDRNNISTLTSAEVVHRLSFSYGMAWVALNYGPIIKNLA